MTYTSQKRTTRKYSWHKENSTIWHDTWTFQRILLSCWVHISKRNIRCYKVSRPWERIKSFSRSKISHHWFITTTLLEWSNLDLEYDAMEWRLFIDSSSRSLKAVLQHNKNSFSILLLYWIRTKVKKNSQHHLMSAVKYQEHKWSIYDDLKVIGLVFGHQSGYIKYP